MNDNPKNLPARTEPESSEFLLYQTEDGRTRVQVRITGETVWLTQKQMADLFQKDVRTINEHLQTVFDEGELSPESVIRKFRITASDGKMYDTLHYNLDVIISVGYRVKSLRGTQFRIWATQRLREYIVKGFALDDERLKKAGGGDYFDELLARIRDIRSSEKVFWRKVLDIYAMSVDYDPNTELSRAFFTIIQNKMHWAAHGHTAAEIIHDRADASRPNMGLTTWSGARPCKADIGIAKNYLNHDEIDALNRIVSFYLDFAELQALNRKLMYMRDWIIKLDDFLKLSEREILTHPGRISHEAALAKAQVEYEKFRALEATRPSLVEKHFSKAIEHVKQLEQGVKKEKIPRKSQQRQKNSKKMPASKRRSEKEK
ncbi:MAG: hydroxyacid dehydrogenase [Desulfobacteraceae bacterium]|nr:MAG: hydroxyacid dehydrogenase [Desulfobacteraceae bacterium]